MNHFIRKHSRTIIEKINTDNVKLFILFIPLIIILFKQLKAGTFSFDELLDTNIIVSFIFIFICDGIAKLLTNYIAKYCEDSNKLMIDYNQLSKKYIIDKHKMIKTYNCATEEYIPVLCEAIADSNTHLKIELSDENARTKYELPSQVKEFTNELMNAHKNSIVYNNRNIRLDDLEKNGEKIILKYSTTTYYDSLMTNRAIDYKLSNGKTIREIYEPGPYISDLKDSKMSNHLGFNGFVELKDGNIVFVLRGKNLSIGKGTWGNSIGASMKTKYCLNDNHLLTVPGIGNAIRKEIEDELKIEISQNNNVKLAEESIFAFYRDLLEGGKPQFLFYYKCNEFDKDSFIKNFENKSNKKDGQNALVDGTKFIFYKTSDLKEATISSDGMRINGINHKMTPSASASVVMLIQWMTTTENNIQ